YTGRKSQARPRMRSDRNWAQRLPAISLRCLPRSSSSRVASAYPARPVQQRNHQADQPPSSRSNRRLLPVSFRSNSWPGRPGGDNLGADAHGARPTAVGLAHGNGALPVKGTIEAMTLREREQVAPVKALSRLSCAALLALFLTGVTIGAVAYAQ